jgi:general secretion pathway protein K
MRSRDAHASREPGCLDTHRRRGLVARAKDGPESQAEQTASAGPASPRGGFGRDQRGLALIAVLWAVALVAILAAQVIGRTTQDLRLARNLAERTAVELAADGGIRYAIAELAGGRDALFDTDGRMRLAVGDAIVQVEVSSEAERVDLNAAAPALIEALLVTLSVPSEEARWAAGLIAEARTGGLEVGTLGAGPRPRFFVMPLDLARVPSLPEDFRRLLMPYVTTFTGKAWPAAETRLTPVRRALDLLEQQERGPAESPSSWTAVAYGLGASGSEPRVPERTVRIVATATGQSGSRFVRTTVVVLHLGRGDDHTVLLWQRSWGGE